MQLRSSIVTRRTGFQAPRSFAFVILLGQASALLHAVFVPHVTCLQHGDRVHVVARATNRAEVPPSGAMDGAIAESEDAGDPCLLDEDSEHAGAAPPVGAPVPVAASAPSPVSQRATLSVARAPLYRLAPKNSPPA